VLTCLGKRGRGGVAGRRSEKRSLQTRIQQDGAWCAGSPPSVQPRGTAPRPLPTGRGQPRGSAPSQGCGRRAVAHQATKKGPLHSADLAQLLRCAIVQRRRREKHFFPLWQCRAACTTTYSRWQRHQLHAPPSPYKPLRFPLHHTPVQSPAITLQMPIPATQPVSEDGAEEG